MRLQVPSDQVDLDLCLFSGQVFRWKKEGDSYFGIDGETHYSIRPSGEFFEIETSGTVGAAESFLNLRRDLRTVESELIKADSRMAECIAGLSGLRVLRPSDPTEVFFSFLCTANNHIKRITPMVAKLAEYGQSVQGTRRFPRAEIVAGIPEMELRAKGFGYRGATIPHAAKEVVGRGGDEWIAGLKRVGYEDAHKELVSIKGIGNKLADCICLYGLHYEEAVPIDTHLWQAACRVFFPEHAGKALTELRYREVGDFFRDRFGESAGWAHLYLYFDNMRRRGV